MARLAVFFLLANTVLFTVGAVLHFRSKALSLPLAPVLTVLTAILPLASFLNAFVYPSLLRTSSLSASRLGQLAPTILQVAQALATTALATLWFGDVTSSAAVKCVMKDAWTALFRDHDAKAIRYIQDSLNCCGFNSVVDMAYPFPKQGPSTCAQAFGRDTPCRAPWIGALRGNAGSSLGVVLAVGVLQLLGLFFMHEGESWWSAWWPRNSRQDQRGQREAYFDPTRPLLEQYAEADERGEVIPSGRHGYGTRPIEAGPRVEPASITEQVGHGVWDNDQSSSY